MKILDSYAIKVSDWMPVSQFPSKRTKRAADLETELGKFGVYQVALYRDIEEIDQNLVHPLIGYTGKSTTIISRIYDIKASAQNKNNSAHGAGRYIRQNNINLDDVYVRILNTEEGEESNLEYSIHNATMDEYSQRFAWKTASSGNDGLVSDLLDRIEKLDDPDVIDDIIKLARERLKDVLLEKFESERQQDE